MYSPDPGPRVSDGRQDSKRVPPSKQYDLSRCTILQLESKNHQATDWKTSHQIPRHGYILLLQVLPRLKVRIEDELLPCFFLFGTFPYLCSGNFPCLRPYLDGKGENYPSESHHCLLTILSCFSDHNSESCVRSSPRNPLRNPLYIPLGLPFPFPSFQLAAIVWSGLPDTLSVVPCPET